MIAQLKTKSCGALCVPSSPADTAVENNTVLDRTSLQMITQSLSLLQQSQTTKPSDSEIVVSCA